MSTSLDPSLAQQVAIDVLGPEHEIDNASKLKEISRAFISDTLTAPTKEMQAYAAFASLGDDVYHEPSTVALEKHIAKITGKEAGLFMPSGTMSNQIALRCHLIQPPHSVLCDVRSHVHKFEAGGIAFHSQASTITVTPANGFYLTAKEVEAELVLEDDPHYAPTRVISLENTLSGIIFPQEEISKIAALAREYGLKMHLDGARIWHVAAEAGLSLRELCAPFDTVSLCFSKGLGAPIGSCLVGSASLIKKARAFRKGFGGGMRQTGFMAAAAAYALTNNFPLLPQVHSEAKRLKTGLEELGARIVAPVDTCMIFYDPSPLGLRYDEILDRAAQLPEPLILGGSRLVIHIQTDSRAIDDFLNLVRTLAEEKKKAGLNNTGVDSSITSATKIYVRPKKPLVKPLEDPATS